jgi:hypothetical protein
MAWDKAQVKMFVKAVRAEVGDFWKFVTPEIREALIAKRAMLIVIGQNGETQRTEDIEKLFRDMLEEAGLEP